MCPRDDRTSSPRSRRGGNTGPERRRDDDRRAVVDTALALAEAEARWRDYGDALRYLDAADELSDGALGPRWAPRREEWEDALAKRRPPPRRPPIPHPPGADAPRGAAAPPG